MHRWSIRHLWGFLSVAQRRSKLIYIYCFALLDAYFAKSPSVDDSIESSCGFNWGSLMSHKYLGRIQQGNGRYKPRDDISYLPSVFTPRVTYMLFHESIGGHAYVVVTSYDGSAVIPHSCRPSFVNHILHFPQHRFLCLSLNQPQPSA